MFVLGALQETQDFVEAGGIFDESEEDLFVADGDAFDAAEDSFEFGQSGGDVFQI